MSICRADGKGSSVAAVSLSLFPLPLSIYREKAEQLGKGDILRLLPLRAGKRGRGDYRGARISINWAKHTFQRRFFKDLEREGWMGVGDIFLLIGIDY